MPTKEEGYLGNPLLKPIGVVEHLTQEQVDEYARCSENVEYFIENYVNIITLNEGLQKISMYEYQKKMVREFEKERFVITKMPRQSGKSTIVTSYILWKILFEPYQNVAILANNAKLAAELLTKVKLAFMYLPKWMQQGVIRFNVNDIELENGSRVAAAATKGDSIRGGSYNLILLDEFAFVPRNIAEDFFTSVYPTISAGKRTQMIIVSTPKGMNHFHKMWFEAQQGISGYSPIEVHWRETPGRGDQFKIDTIKNMGELKWRQEFETEFLGSVATLIDPSKIRTMVHKTPFVEEKFKIEMYEPPMKDHVYVITVDTSHGLEQDYSAFIITDVTETPYKLVAKYRSNIMSPSLYPETILYAAHKYNDAYILPETNDIGMTVAESLHEDFEYENVLTTIPKGAAGQQIHSGYGGTSQRKFGVRMTKQVKRIGCSHLKDIIEGDKYILYDHDVIEELSTFVAKKESWSAEEGCHDDLVMCLVIFAWLSRQPYFKDLTDTNVRWKLAQQHYANLMEELPIPGFIDDGMEYETLDPNPTLIDSGFIDPKL